jgi:putative ABC transport system substrate-binding protein
VRRRALLGGIAATLSTAAHAQPKAMPVIGFLGTSSPAPNMSFIAQLRRGLVEGGYEEGRTVAIEYRWAEGRYDRLPALAAEFVARKVDVIVSQGGSTPAVDAMKVTRTIPIVFITGGDPVADGLVTNLARPTANATGVTWLSSNLGPKRLELLRELSPRATTFALMVNPDAVETERIIGETQTAAQASGVGLHVLKAHNDVEIEQAFAAVARARDGGLVAGVDAFFGGRRQLIAALAAKHGVPVMGGFREYAADGCLMSYGPSLADTFRQGGLYAAKILKGAKPGDLPVLQPTIFELTINQKAAKAIGLMIPPSLLARADEVIE